MVGIATIQPYPYTHRLEVVGSYLGKRITVSDLISLFNHPVYHVGTDREVSL